MQKFAEDDRIEQMKQAQRRMKQLEHRRAVDALIAERHRILKEHEDEEKKLDELEREVSKYKEAVIEQERQRLLREHAAKLAGFLPKVFVVNDREYYVTKLIWTCLTKNLKRNSIFVNKKYVSFKIYYVTFSYARIVFLMCDNKVFMAGSPIFGNTRKLRSCSTSLVG
jgi:hypothetical protein